MTPEKRTALRGELLADLDNAIDDEKTHCAELDKLVKRLEDTARHARSRTLRCQRNDHGLVFFIAKDTTSPVPASTWFALPSAEELATALTDCLNATARRAEAERAAQDAGALDNLTSLIRHR